MPFTVALAGFTLVGLLGSTLANTSPAKTAKGRSLQLVKLGSALLLLLPIIIARSVLRHDYPDSISIFRQLLVLASVFAMTALVFTRQWQLMTDLKKAADDLRRRLDH